MKRIADRAVRSIVTAPFQRRHWRALRTELHDVRPAGEFLWRYLSQRGSYPWTVSLRTPTGVVTPTLYSRHDLLTVNEVFCRRDYPDPIGPLVVDIGANIGLSALYFLTRRSNVRVWCYEPNPLNAERLRANLAPFGDRSVVQEAAVARRGGKLGFRLEPTGRYGHLLENGGDIEVEVLAVCDIVAAVGGVIDLIKIDTEGNEGEILAALPLQAAREVVWEDEIGRLHRRCGPT